MKAPNAQHAAAYAEYACQTFTMKHAKQYLRDCGLDLAVFEVALKARRKEVFLDEMYTIQANARWAK